MALAAATYLTIHNPVHRHNGMSGELRLNMAGMSMLQVLYLSHNKLLEPLALGLFAHPALEQLTLSYNIFTSLQVSGSYGTDNQPIVVNLSYNKIHGPLPIFMATMPSLSTLLLQYNGMMTSRLRVSE
jgi:hypothetical protein